MGAEAAPLERAEPRSTSAAARKRAAVEIVAHHEPSLRRTARRYSLCAEDAEDACQRALEILLTKAPTTDERELIRWTQTVTKHEALALRRSRERLLGRAGLRPENDEEPVDRVALVPAEGDGPAERAERREAIARSREALKALKPAELRTLSLLAGGYSYAEIGEITGFSHTKVNRSLAEGRERFRRFLSHSEDGSRCGELRPLLSAFCDGEASPQEATVLREHLRACAACRSTMRAYRATPRAVAALLPAWPVAQLLGRVRELFAGAKGTATAGMAKGLAVCVGAVGGAACVATGVVPGPFDGPSGHAKQPEIQRRLDRSTGVAATKATPRPRRKEAERPKQAEQAAVQTAAVEYVPPPPAPAAPEPAPAPAPSPPPAPAPAPPSGAATSGSSSGSAAGEFGP